MKNYLLLSSLLLFAISSSAQRSFQVKVYQNTDYFDVSYYNSQTNSSRNSNELNFSRISLAFAINTRKNFVHEIEIIIPELSKSIYNVKLPLDYSFQDDGPRVGTISTYSFRYELSKVLSNPSKKFRFNLGLAINPYFTDTEYEPENSIAYYKSNTKLFGVSFNIVPRINYNITDRILIDLNIPFKLYDLQNKETRINNPALPIRQQTSSEFTNVFFEDVYTIRLGVSYVFK